MTISYSTNLALSLIGDGDQAGTWGQTTNTNLGTLLEQAISGYQTQAVSTGTDTTVTIPNGASGAARNMFLELTGTGGASTNLIVPANKKLYFIYNNTTGQVTVKVTGLTGVSVPSGAKMVLVSNGTDIVTAQNYLASLTLGSALPVASGGTGVTASTGSGSVVLSTSPTLVTPVLGTPSSGTLTSCTGLPLTSGVTGTLPVANGGTGVTASTGSGNLVLATSPTLVTPILGTPSSGTLTSCTGLPLTSGVTGTLPVANGGTGVTTSTGSGSVVFSTSPALTTPILGTPTSGNLSNCTADGTNAVGFLGLPQSSNTTLATSDRGKCVLATGTITVPTSTFAAGDVVTIFNNSGASITITSNLTTTYLAGTSTVGTTRTLAQRGVATIYFVSSTVGVISGAGLT